MTSPVTRRLAQISPKAYEHPADRAATAALKSIPGLDAVVRKLIEFRYERAFRQGLMAASVRIGPQQLPDVWNRYENVLATLDMPGLYDLYLTQAPIANAAAVGSQHPMIIINSQSLTLFDDAELETVLAHEAGHILSEHVMYQTALMILLQLVPIGRVPALAGLPLIAIRSALLEWFRAAELSADRAATLVNRDPLVTARTLMVLAAGVPSSKLDLDSFLRQGQDYHEWSSAWDRVSRLLNELNLTHSYPVRRVAELMDWVRSGEYDRIIGGDFPTRDQAPDPKEEAGKAYDHYREKFRKTFEDAGESFDKTVNTMSEWLKRR
ncbi:MAG TPA: M48 family metallopeptidase [Gaiellaceae bacterium]|nr:M48 family metallopeptidase [Gaiellaceae bacterium]